MKKNGLALPVHLQNGQKLPARFKDVCSLVPTAPRYKIVVFSIDTWSSYYRLVHAYYVSLLSNDPSQLQALMRSRSRTPSDGFEDGQLVKDMMVYREYLPIARMAELGAALNSLVQQYSEAYAMVRFHNLVQYARDSFSEPIVIGSPDYH